MNVFVWIAFSAALLGASYRWPKVARLVVTLGVLAVAPYSHDLGRALVGMVVFVLRTL